ncbi:G [Escherichia phage phiK]|uniref:Major spike protein G n=1 Tax=Enterobacteria phage phiK TaxID=10848 RepID=G_BPPHK|nr:G [Escherichia phage phiK] [Escherichia phage phiK]Q38042.1 RecName: Full=Major spike protein G; AltName: Full=G protein; AltName: Full=GPG [Alphatrevirus phiK]CAA42892.1 G [Escherichia phage phiK] [Escherichia phage phiK]
MYQIFVTKHDTAIQTSRFSVTGSITPVAPTGNIPVINTGNITAEHAVVSLYANLTAGTSSDGSFIVAMKVDTSPADPNCVISAGVNLSFAGTSYPIVGIVRFESASDQPTSIAGSQIEHYPIEMSVGSGGVCSARDCVTVDIHPRAFGNNVFVGVICSSAKWTSGRVLGTIATTQVIREYQVLQPLK